MPIVLLLIALAVALAIRARRQDLRAAEAKRAGCAACRGDRGGEAVLQAPDAALCPEHWQRRRRIERLESTLLGGAR